jgi:hypothetical protein
MRRFILWTVGLLLLSIPGWAQESAYPKAEVFGGFSIASMGVSSTATDPVTGLPVSVSTRESFWGWQASLAGNLHRHLGFVGDFGGQYKNVAGIGISNYQYMFGPRISIRGEKITPFVHGLFGASRASVVGTDPVSGLTIGVSSTGFGMGLGGGLDVNISHRLALRVPQFDWTPLHAGGVWTNNVIRIGIGLVVKAGE